MDMYFTVKIVGEWGATVNRGTIFSHDSVTVETVETGLLDEDGDDYVQVEKLSGKAVQSGEKLYYRSGLVEDDNTEEPMNVFYAIKE